MSNDGDADGVGDAEYVFPGDVSVIPILRVGNCLFVCLF